MGERKYEIGTILDKAVCKLCTRFADVIFDKPSLNNLPDLEVSTRLGIFIHNLI